MKILKHINPEDSMLRKRHRLQRRVYHNKINNCVHYLHFLFCKQGPNYLWHIDGYDKWKPYGFAIHGCIDG